MCEEVTDRRERSGTHAARGRPDREHRCVRPHGAARGGDHHALAIAARRQGVRGRVLVHERAPLDQPRAQARAPAGPGAGWRNRARARRRGRPGRRSGPAQPPRPARSRLRALPAPRRPRRPRRSRGRTRARWTRARSRTGRTRRPRRSSRHHSPMAPTVRLEASSSARAGASPKRALSAAALSQSDSQKPPLRPLGPWPQTPPSTRATRAPGRARAGATPSTGP